MRSLLVSALLALASAASVLAQTSTTRLIPYAGVAVDDGGRPRSGQVAATFELYEEQEGGAPLWRETQRVTADERGRYLVYLGSATPMPQFAFSEERARWLAVSIENSVLPRVMLVAVPYALRAADAESLGGQPASSFVRSRPDGRFETNAGLVAEAAVDGSGVGGQLAKWASSTFLSSSVISESATNRVGVGLPDPTGGGVVDSVFTIRNFDNNTGFAVLNQSQARRYALNTLATGGWTTYDGGSGVWNQGLTQVDGRVGIGTTNPVGPTAFVGGRLHVVPGPSDRQAIFARKTASNAMAIHARSGPGISGPIITAVVGSADNEAIGIDAALMGVHSSSGIGIYAQGSPAILAAGTTAGQFTGNVTVSGTLTKGGGAFQIDHPLDPANKYLRHSFVESPDMMNVYNGNVTLDTQGEAWVSLPDWFDVLNRDFRYQLTAVGAPGPKLYVASKVTGNRFKIAGGTPDGEVSWQVTGIRQDAWANAHRIEVEGDKPAGERGRFLHPVEHGQPESASSLPLATVRTVAVTPTEKR